jgi:BASS family bile acid:Na+ symporter
MLNSAHVSKTTCRMFLLKNFMAVFAFIGRYGTIAVALSILLGIVFPRLAALFKPVLGEAVVALLVLSFLRVHPAALGALARRPLVVLLASGWLMVLLPAAFALAFTAIGLNKTMPELYLILILQSCSPALMSAPAMAALMGLDVALTLACLLGSMALVPLVAGAVTHFFLGQALIEPIAFGLKLFALIGGSAVAAAVVRWFAGSKAIEANYELLDGLSVVAMFVFAMAAMDGVTAYALADPKLVAALTFLVFALSLGTIFITTLVFLAAGRQRAFAIGILTGNRNMGVMLAATGFAIPPVAWLYFGLAQFPIYLLPVVLKWLAGRIGQPDRQPRSSDQGG